MKSTSNKIVAAEADHVCVRPGDKVLPPAGWHYPYIHASVLPLKNLYNLIIFSKGPNIIQIIFLLINFISFQGSLMERISLRLYSYPVFDYIIFRFLQVLYSSAKNSHLFCAFGFAVQYDLFYFINGFFLTPKHSIHLKSWIIFVETLFFVSR